MPRSLQGRRLWGGARRGCTALGAVLPCSSAQHSHRRAPRASCCLRVFSKRSLLCERVVFLQEPSHGGCLLRCGTSGSEWQSDQSSMLVSTLKQSMRIILVFKVLVSAVLLLVLFFCLFYQLLLLCCADCVLDKAMEVKLAPFPWGIPSCLPTSWIIIAIMWRTIFPPLFCLIFLWPWRTYLSSKWWFWLLSDKFCNQISFFISEHVSVGSSEVESMLSKHLFLMKKSGLTWWLPASL